MLIDTHCHINTLSAIQRDTVCSVSKDNYLFIDSSIDLDSTKESLKLSSEYEFIYSAIGFHPFSAADYDEDILDIYQQFIDSSKKIVAIGEIGLDYMAKSSLEDQSDIFIKLIKLAKKNRLPIAIHNRFDKPHVFDILREYYSSYEDVIFHCFSYGKDMLEKIVEKGGFVSFSLNVLRNKKDILESVVACPLENIILETDSPYMRIERNPSSPLDVNKVYSLVASAKGIDIDMLKSKVEANVRRVYKLSLRG